MKKLTAVTGTLIILLASVGASARSLRPMTYVLSANIESMNIGQDSHLSEMAIYGGQIKIDQVKKEISLEENHAPKCAPGFACPEVLLIHSITLPIVSQTTDSCGAMVYTAERDLLPIDGTREVLIVRDNNFNKCHLVCHV